MMMKTSDDDNAQRKTEVLFFFSLTVCSSVMTPQELIARAEAAEQELGNVESIAEQRRVDNQSLLERLVDTEAIQSDCQRKYAKEVTWFSVHMRGHILIVKTRSFSVLSVQCAHIDKYPCAHK